MNEVKINKNLMTDTMKKILKKLFKVLDLFSEISLLWDENNLTSNEYNILNSCYKSELDFREISTQFSDWVYDVKKELGKKDIKLFIAYYGNNKQEFVDVCSGPDAPHIVHYIKNNTEYKCYSVKPIENLKDGERIAMF